MSSSPGGTRADEEGGTGRGGREAGGPETGTVRWFDERRGYGFIARDGAIDVFFHGSAVAAPRPLAPGDRVAFEVVDAPRGLQARAVRLVDLASGATSGGTSGEPAS